MDSEEVMFRKYTPDDLMRCSALAQQAWPMRGSRGSEPGDIVGFSPWIESTAESSTWTEVAVVSGKVVGFLFGVVNKLKPKEGVFEQVGGMLWMFGRVVSRNRHRWNISLKTALSFFFTEFKLEVNRPDADSEIALLIVDEKFRGRRIGKALVDRFVAMAKESGAHAVTLFTDDKVSNWKFYEIYGFKKVVSFYDGISTYFAGGERANAIYYLLELDKK